MTTISLDAFRERACATVAKLAHAAPTTAQASKAPTRHSVTPAHDPKRWWMGSLRDHELLRQTDEHDARDRECTAGLLARLAEIDRRKLYRDAGYPSMFAYCARSRHYSEHAAYTRIRAARLARRWPRIFDAVADGRLHVSALAMLAPVLTAENASDLLLAAEYATKTELRTLLAERFPRPDVPTCMHVLVPMQPVVPDLSCQLGPDRVAITSERLGGDAHESVGDPAAVARDPELGPERVEFPGNLVTSEQAVALTHRADLVPLAPQRVALQVTISVATQAKLQRAQELLGHAAPTTALAEVLDQALDALVEKLEKRRCAAVATPRAAASAPSANPRYIPAAERRAVRARDRDQCTFEANGHRCEARSSLHFDHIRPVADGGTSTVANLRLLCGAHNQLEAERRFGAGFMEAKREARRAAGAG